MRYQNLGTGFWGIIDDNGNEWRPVDLPDVLQDEGKKVSMTIMEVEEEMSMFMWGIPVRIIAFEL